MLSIIHTRREVIIQWLTIPFRITPGHGYLEALSADNVEVRTDQILKIVPEGIQMEDGTIFTLDSIICATGFDTSFCPAFPVIGQQGKDLGDVWKDEPRSYLSVTASGFPNYFGMFTSMLHRFHI